MAGDGRGGSRRVRGNGEGSVYFRTRDEKWCAAVSLPGGKRRVRTAAKKSDAQRLLRDMQATYRAARPVTSGRDTLQHHAARWLADVGRQKLSAHSLHDYELALGHVMPYCGSVALGTLKGSHVQACYTALQAGGLSGNYVNHIHTVLQSVVEQAVLWELIMTNPVRHAQPPRLHKQEMKALSIDQVQRLIAASHGQPLGAMLYLLVTTGLRVGEAGALRWTDLDLERPSLQVRRTITSVLGGGYEFGPVKTPASRRLVHLTAGLVEALREHHAMQRANPILSMEQLVFTTSIGTPARQGSVQAALRRALKVADLPMIRVHDLRHTAASVLLAQGVPARVVQEMLGHSSITTTLGTYAHVMPSMHRDAATMLDTLLRGST